MDIIKVSKSCYGNYPIVHVGFSSKDEEELLFGIADKCGCDTVSTSRRFEFICIDNEQEEMVVNALKRHGANHLWEKK